MIRVFFGGYSVSRRIVGWILAAHLRVVRVVNALTLVRGNPRPALFSTPTTTGRALRSPVAGGGRRPGASRLPAGGGP